ncbi:hypothetical protein ACFDR9_003388 [Janthinobacterium sp. CG_23.3]|uniref:FFLEELY motif protein n=1 Tax=unclassified Janthinobacterium TaxID=2610881 RepID=UPI00034A87F9|nr:MULTISPECIES: hypothetical protein [unclassified Janthinobacterium]MEC5163655.1 hypothetical protein [Janthinobacterium sp. CG_S6]
MRKEDLVKTLEQQLGAVKAERLAARRDPGLLAARTALKQFQSARLARSHADLLAAPDSHHAALFFLDELYGSADLSQRDADLARIVPTMQRLLPLHALQTITQAIVLDALSERLDTALARALGAAFSEQQYIDGYRAVSAHADRDSQLTLVKALGDSLCELVRVPFLATTLGVMRGPARLAGLGDLHRFLERGFSTFKQMKRPRDFVATIVGRERSVLENIFCGRAQPFELGGG